MVAKANKRAVSTAPVAKDAKKPRVDTRISSIIDTLENAELPDTCRSMLSILAQSLLTPKDARHKLQSMCVAMVDETLQETKSKLMSSIASSQWRLSEIEASKSGLVARVEEAASISSARAEAESLASKALGEASSGVNAAKATVVEKEAAKEKSENDLVSATDEKATAESLVGEHFRAPFDAGESPHYAHLKDMVTKLGLDESFTSALPSSCAKTKEQRGPFDDLVLGEFEKALTRHLASLAEGVTAATAAVPAAEQAATTATTKLHEAETVAEEAEKALELAKVQAAEGAEKLAEAKKALEAVEPSIGEVTNELCLFKSQLELLECGPLAAFTELRDKMSSTPLEEAAPLGA